MAEIIDRPERVYLDSVAEIEEIHENSRFKCTAYTSLLSDVTADIIPDNGGALREVRVKAAGKRFVFRQENGEWRWERR